MAVDVELTFNSGVNELCVNISIIDDSEVEPEENFFVNLTSVSGESILTPVAEVTIVDSEEGKELSISNVACM